MGNGLPRPSASSKQTKVLIVGFSIAGFTIAQLIWDHVQVTVIDEKDYFENITTSMKMNFEPGFEDDVLFPFAQQAAAYPKLTFKQARLTKVNKDNTVVVTSLPSNTQETMTFDILVICTGAIYTNPIRDLNSLTLADRKASVKAFQAKLEAAKSIMVVGAGIAGVEFTGELAHHYSAKSLKKVTLCLRGDRLLPTLPVKAGRLAEDYFKSQGVTILKNTAFGAGTAADHGSDLVVECTGYKFNPSFMKDNFGECLAPNGQIYVNDLFQISRENPRVNAVAEGVAQNIFAYGDVCQTSLNENKSAVSIKFLADQLVGNILQLAAGLKPSNQIPSSVTRMGMVSLGPVAGIMCVNGLVSFGAEIGKKKYELTQDTKDVILGKAGALEGTQKKIGGFKKALSCVTFCCCCCPCSNCFTPAAKSKQRLTLADLQKTAGNKA